MTQHSTPPTGEYGREIAGACDRSRMTEQEDAAIKRVKPRVLDPVVDGGARQPQFEELRTGDDASLLRGEFRYRTLGPQTRHSAPTRGPMTR
jgi:hypothetical protein